jgi:hypothetical protein
MTYSDDVRKQLGIDITYYQGARYKQWMTYWKASSACTWRTGSGIGGCVTLPRCMLAHCEIGAQIRSL